MADYTDIDKLRELAEAAKACQVKVPELEPDRILALVAELVGLRTEVDQLRGDNHELTHRLVKAEDSASHLRAERVALQARIDAATTEMQNSITSFLPDGADHCEVAANDAIRRCLAALGVDPQKEERA